MSKNLIIGLIAGAAAAAAAAIYFKKRSAICCCDDDFDDELDCDCCDGCCDCEDAYTDIPAEKAEENGVIITDSCVAYGNSEDEALDSLNDTDKSDKA